MLVILIGCLSQSPGTSYHLIVTTGSSIAVAKKSDTLSITMTLGTKRHTRGASLFSLMSDQPWTHFRQF